MKIGYIVKMFPRISETFILNEILELERQGAEVTVFSLKKPNEGKFHPQMNELKADILYLDDCDVKTWSGWISNEWDYLQDYNDNIWNLVNESLKRKDTSRIDNIWRAAWICSKASRLGIERVHAHFASLPSTVAYLSHRISGIPFSFTAHAKDIFVYDMEEHYLREKLQHASFVVTVTNYNKNYLLENAPETNPDIIKVLYNGVNLVTLQPVAKSSRKSKTILGVGRLVEKKGFNDLLNALVILKKQKVDFECVIVGTGPEEENLLQLKQELNLENDVTFLGSKTSDEVTTLMKEATVFCLPCIIAEDNNIDALPTVLLEALALGLPSISTSISGIPEIIEHEHNGLLAEQKKPEQLAELLERLLLTPKLCDEYALIGRKIAEEKFSLRTNAGTLFKMFKDDLQHCKRQSENLNQVEAN